MSRLPGRNQQTPDQKLEALYEWADKLTRTVRDLEAKMRGLDARIRAVEAKGVETSS